MNVGSLAYCTRQGLGVLARDFYDHGMVTHPVLVTRDSLRSHRQHFEWYPAGTPRHPISAINTEQVMNYWLANDVRTFLAFETPFDWRLFRMCKEVGIRTILMTMYECTPARIPVEPDMYLCPSELDMCYFPPGKSFYLPVPVPDHVRHAWRRRDRCETFLHSAGWGGLKGRNGTKEFLEALRYVRSPAKFILRSQEQVCLEVYLGSKFDEVRLQVQIGSFPQEEVWREGDCLVFPEKFNGLSLPLQEARASGMLVMCGDRFPMNRWLPRDPLIRPSHFTKGKIGGPYMEYEEAHFSPEAIAAKIDEWYGRDLSAYSEAGKKWADENSWDVLGLIYRSLLVDGV